MIVADYHKLSFNDKQKQLHKLYHFGDIEGQNGVYQLMDHNFKIIGEYADKETAVNEFYDLGRCDKYLFFKPTSGDKRALVYYLIPDN